MTPNLALRAVLPWLAAMALLLAPCHAGADERIGVMAASLEQAKDGPNGAIVLNATFEFELPQALEEAVQKGIALYFNIEFELFRKRWYWFDRRIASSALVYRLSYSPLTRQYRLARGGLSQPFESLDEALALVKSASPTLSSGAFSTGQQITYKYDITNTGNVTLTPSVATPLKVTDSDMRVTMGAACNLTTGSLAPGATHSCTGLLELQDQDIEAGSVTSTGTASAKFGGTAVQLGGPPGSGTAALGWTSVLGVEQTVFFEFVEVELGRVVWDAECGSGGGQRVLHFERDTPAPGHGHFVDPSDGRLSGTTGGAKCGKVMFADKCCRSRLHGSQIQRPPQVPGRPPRQW